MTHFRLRISLVLIVYLFAEYSESYNRLKRSDSNDYDNEYEISGSGSGSGDDVDDEDEYSNLSTRKGSTRIDFDITTVKNIANVTHKFDDHTKGNNDDFKIIEDTSVSYGNTNTDNVESNKDMITDNNKVTKDDSLIRAVTEKHQSHDEDDEIVKHKPTNHDDSIIYNGDDEDHFSGSGYSGSGDSDDEDDHKNVHVNKDDEFSGSGDSDDENEHKNVHVNEDNEFSGSGDSDDEDDHKNKNNHKDEDITFGDDDEKSSKEIGSDEKIHNEFLLTTAKILIQNENIRTTEKISESSNQYFKKESLHTTSKTLTQNEHTTEKIRDSEDHYDHIVIAQGDVYDEFEDANENINENHDSLSVIDFKFSYDDNILEHNSLTHYENSNEIYHKIDEKISPRYGPSNSDENFEEHESNYESNDLIPSLHSVDSSETFSLDNKVKLVDEKKISPKFRRTPYKNNFYMDKEYDKLTHEKKEPLSLNDIFSK